MRFWRDCVARFAGRMGLFRNGRGALVPIVPVPATAVSVRRKNPRIPFPVTKLNAVEYRRAILFLTILWSAFLPTCYATIQPVVNCVPTGGAGVVTDKSVYNIGETVTITMCVSVLPSFGDLVVSSPSRNITGRWHVDFGVPANPGYTATKALTASGSLGRWTVEFSLSGISSTPAVTYFNVQNPIAEFPSVSIVTLVAFTLAAAVLMFHRKRFRLSSKVV